MRLSRLVCCLVMALGGVGGQAMAQGADVETGTTPPFELIPEADAAAGQDGDSLYGNAAGLRLLDQDRFFTESRLGQALLSDLRQAERELDSDNQVLADQLAEEERTLTELRPTLDPEEFRSRADAFDRRVEIIRAERARLSQELARRYESEAQRFFQIALPVLSDLMRDEGIAALLRPEAVILAADWLDITDMAVERLDAATER